MAIFRCYIDKESSTYLNVKIRDKATNKRIVLKNTSASSKMSFKVFLLYHSDDKILFGRDSKSYIEISGTQVGENKSTIYITTKKVDQYWKVVKVK